MRAATAPLAFLALLGRIESFYRSNRPVTIEPMLQSQFFGDSSPTELPVQQTGDHCGNEALESHSEPPEWFVKNRLIFHPNVIHRQELFPQLDFIVAGHPKVPFSH